MKYKPNPAKESKEQRRERLKEMGSACQTKVIPDKTIYNRKEKHKEKFESFLESLKGHGQDSLIESIKKGVNVCLESREAELYDYMVEGTRVKEFALGATITRELLQRFPTFKKYVQASMKEINTNEKWEIYKKYVVDGSIFDEGMLEIGITGNLEMDINISGGYYSASSIGPAEGPDVEHNSTDYEDIKIDINLEGDKLFDIPVEEDSPEMEWAKGMIETYVEEELFDEISSNALEGDDAPRKPRNFRTHYSGPV